MSALRSAAAVLAGLTLAVLPAVPASAHSVLLATSPADGGTVTVVTTEVTLTFNEPVKGSFSTVSVTGPRGIAYGDGALRVVDNVVHQPVHALGSGGYQVAWRVVSADGHPVSGGFAFNVALPAELEPVVPTAAAAVPPADPVWSAWWWAVGLVVAAGLALVVVRVGRRGRVS